MRWVLIGALTLSAGHATAEPVRPALVVYAAGSTTGVLQALLDRYTARTGQQVVLRTGPAGLMRERIEAGDKVDLFVSANMAHPQRLHAEGLAGPVLRFARNSLCVTALPRVGLTRANLLDRLLDPAVRIGTSTPGADPGGDYAHTFFENADRVRPGATTILKGKARQVVGGRIGEPQATPNDNAAETMKRRGVDVSIGYCSSRTTTPDRSVMKVRVPAPLAVSIRYGMTIITSKNGNTRITAAGQLATYLQGPQAESLLAIYGFKPFS